MRPEKCFGITLYNVIECSEFGFSFVESGEFLRLLKQRDSMIKAFIKKKKYSLGLEARRLVWVLLK